MGDSQSAFRNIDSLIGDALQGAVDFEDGDDHTQVVGDGLMQRQNFKAFFLEIHFQTINLFVCFDQPFGKGNISFRQGFD